MALFVVLRSDGVVIMRSRESGTSIVIGAEGIYHRWCLIEQMGRVWREREVGLQLTSRVRICPVVVVVVVPEETAARKRDGKGLRLAIAIDGVAALVFMAPREG